MDDRLNDGAVKQRGSFLLFLFLLFFFRKYSGVECPIRRLSLLFLLNRRNKMLMTLGRSLELALLFPLAALELR